MKSCYCTQHARKLKQLYNLVICIFVTFPLINKTLVILVILFYAVFEVPMFNHNNFSPSEVRMDKMAVLFIIYKVRKPRTLTEFMKISRFVRNVLTGRQTPRWTNEKLKTSKFLVCLVRIYISLIDPEAAVNIGRKFTFLLFLFSCFAPHGA